MALDPRQSINNLTKSIKKFILDGMQQDLDTKFLFGLAYSNTPYYNGEQAEKWVCVEYGSLNVNGYMATSNLNFHLYHRNDQEYVKLYKLRDAIAGYFYDYTKIDPQVCIPLYDTRQVWEIVAHMKALISYEGDARTIADDTATKSLRVDIKWAVK